MYTFLANLTTYLERHGVEYTRDASAQYDVMFVNSFAVPYETVLRVKRERSNVRVVHRVDGSARDYGRNDDADDNQARVNLLADLTIFQSRYSKYSSREKYRVIPHDGRVIYNAVDIETFRPSDSERRDLARPRVANAAFSVNRRKGTWQIQQLAEQNTAVDFILCGRYPTTLHAPNIHCLGRLGRPGLAAAMRSCDVFLGLSENDSCPNVVIEALASGLPVLYKDSGGVPELVGDCGFAVELSTFRVGLERALARYEELRSAARRRATEHFSPDVVFPQYLTAIESAARRPLPTYATVVTLARQGYPWLVLPGHRTPRSILVALRRGLARLRDRLVPGVPSSAT